MLELLIAKKGHKINSDSLNRGWKYKKISYLHLAAINPNTFSLMVTLIEEKNFGIKNEDHMGANVMFYAAVNENLEVLEYLKLERRMCLREFDDKKNTPLIMATLAGHQENIDFILRMVPSAMKDKSNLKLNPVQTACRQGNLTSLKNLL